VQNPTVASLILWDWKKSAAKNFDSFDSKKEQLIVSQYNGTAPRQSV
jgi:hypothetical protein